MKHANMLFLTFCLIFRLNIQFTTTPLFNLPNMCTEPGGRFVPVSSSEWHTALLPDEVRFGVSSNLAFKHNASSLHQLLSGGLLDEEGSGSLSCTHLHHHLFLCLNGNTEGNQQLDQTLKLWKLHVILQWLGQYMTFTTHVFS